MLIEDFHANKRAKIFFWHLSRNRDIFCLVHHSAQHSKNRFWALNTYLVNKIGASCLPGFSANLSFYVAQMQKLQMPHKHLNQRESFISSFLFMSHIETLRLKVVLEVPKITAN